MRYRPSHSPDFLSQPGALTKISEALGAKKHILQEADSWRKASISKVGDMQEALAIPAGLQDQFSDADHEDYQDKTSALLARMDDFIEQLQLMDPDFQKMVEEVEDRTMQEMLGIAQEGSTEYPLGDLFSAYDLRQVLEERDRGGARAFRSKFAQLQDELDGICKAFSEAEAEAEAIFSRVRSNGEQ